MQGALLRGLVLWYKGVSWEVKFGSGKDNGLHLLNVFMFPISQLSCCSVIIIRLYFVFLVVRL